MNINIETKENGMEININGITINIPTELSVETSKPKEETVVEETAKHVMEVFNQNEYEKADADAYQQEYLNALESTHGSKEAKEVVKLLKEEVDLSQALFELALADFNNNYKNDIKESIIDQLNEKYGHLNLSYNIEFDKLNGESIEKFDHDPNINYCQKKAKTYRGKVTTTILDTTMVLGYISSDITEEPKIMDTASTNPEKVIDLMKKYIKKFDDKLKCKEVKSLDDVCQFELKKILNRGVSRSDKKVLSPTKEKGPSFEDVQKLKNTVSKADEVKKKVKKGIEDITKNL